MDSSSSYCSSEEIEHLSIVKQHPEPSTGRLVAHHRSDQQQYNNAKNAGRNQTSTNNSMGIVPDDRIPPAIDHNPTDESNTYFEEEREGESEYYYIEEATTQPPPPRPTSESSDSATIQFYTDDRIVVGQHQTDHTEPIDENDEDEFIDHQTQRAMSVDYSSNDFRRSLAAINAAASSRSADGYATGGVRVRKEGDTTIMTEHRDPYSFYWQLDKARRQQTDPYRPPPTSEYVIDEEIVDDEEEEEEEQYVLDTFLQ
jgi:hypothetical protein